MLQQWSVNFLVFCAALYATWRFMPASLRRPLAVHIRNAAHRLGLKGKKSGRILSALNSSPTCGSCDSCGSCRSSRAPDTSSPHEGSSQMRFYAPLRRHRIGP